MKKMLAAALAASMVMGLTACGGVGRVAVHHSRQKQRHLKVQKKQRQQQREQQRLQQPEMRKKRPVLR